MGAVDFVDQNCGMYLVDHSTRDFVAMCLQPLCVLGADKRLPSTLLVDEEVHREHGHRA